MERKTQGEARKERFNAAAKAAKEITDLALREIDAALADEAELLASLNIGVQYGNLTPEEADLAIIAYRSTRYPIQDSDTLASPIGYYEDPPTIYE